MKGRIELQPKRECFLSGTCSGKRIRGSKKSTRDQHKEINKKLCWFLLLHNLTREKCPFRSSHRRCSVKKVFLKFSQISLANTCVGVSFDRSSHRRCSVEKVFLKFFQISQENTYVGMSLIKFVKNFIKKRLQHRFFPVKFAKFLRTPILKGMCKRLLLLWIKLQGQRLKINSIVDSSRDVSGL